MWIVEVRDKDKRVRWKRAYTDSMDPELPGSYEAAEEVFQDRAYLSGPLRYRMRKAK